MTELVELMKGNSAGFIDQSKAAKKAYCEQPAKVRTNLMPIHHGAVIQFRAESLNISLKTPLPIHPNAHPREPNLQTSRGRAKCSADCLALIT